MHTGSFQLLVHLMHDVGIQSTNAVMSKTFQIQINMALFHVSSSKPSAAYGGDDIDDTGSAKYIPGQPVMISRL